MKRVTLPNRFIFHEPNEVYEAESIEEKVRRIVDENEPITDGAPIIFTEAKDGVRPEFDIRTDKWQVAIDAMDKVSNYEASKYTQTYENPEQKINVDYKEAGEAKSPEDN